MNNIIKIERILLSSNEYNESLKLREQILRIPLGLTISAKQIKNEKTSNHYHFIAKQDNHVVAALTMKVNANSIQTCQIATDKNYREKGFGKKILNFGEKYLSSFYKKEFVVFSRLSALKFYIKCDYIFKNEKIYLINDVEHRLLKKP